MAGIEDKISHRKIKGSEYVVHFLILCFLFIFPEVLFSVNKPTLSFVYLKPTFCVFLFYVNYYLLIERFFFDKKKRWIFILSNLILVIVLISIIIYAHNAHLTSIKLNNAPPPPIHLAPPHNSYNPVEEFNIINALQFAIRDLILMILSIALSISLKLITKWKRLESNQQELIAKQQETELTNLKSQLNPHFLFNTLNNIYALIAISQPKAQKAVHELSSLLRYTYDNKDWEVDIEKEITFIENYIELMRLRLSTNVKLNVNITRNYIGSIKIAPLLFISLIENAFKHGTSPTKPSFINIDIKVKQDLVECKTSNNYFPKDKTDKSGSGIGLSNLRKQLSIIYPHNSSLEIINDGTTHTVTLQIKINTEK